MQRDEVEKWRGVEVFSVPNSMGQKAGFVSRNVRACVGLCLPKGLLPAQKELWQQQKHIFCLTESAQENCAGNNRWMWASQLTRLFICTNIDTKPEDINPVINTYLNICCSFYIQQKIFYFTLIAVLQPLQFCLPSEERFALLESPANFWLVTDTFLLRWREMCSFISPSLTCSSRGELLHLGYWPLYLHICNSNYLYLDSFACHTLVNSANTGGTKCTCRCAVLMVGSSSFQTQVRLKGRFITFQHQLQ